MERLTFEGNFCEIAQCACIKCPYDTDCSQKQVWERLKQYEDTKRTPEQIEALEAALMGKAVAQIMEFEGLPIARLRELAVADQEGRVIVLPCKVGDTVFALLDNKSKYVSECEVKKIGLGDNIGFATIVPVGYSQEYGVSLRGFGKTVFLTREEAEKALAELEERDVQ